MGKQIFKLLILKTFLFTSINFAFASKTSISLNDTSFKLTPASDLVFNDRRIDEIDALSLAKKGVDLSKLNPSTSNNLWKNQKFNVDNYSSISYPQSDDVLSFESYKKSPSQIFRAIVNGNNKYILTASLDNHTNILRAGILRLLGYDIDTPKYYKRLKISFKSSSEREKFIELVGEQTLTNRSKWFVKKDGETKLIVKGFTLEPAKLRNVNIHLPLMNRDRQQERRIFRALLEIYVLTDFPQAINKISWKVGRVFNNTLIFNHPYAREFSNVTLDDIKWVHRKITKLSRREIYLAIEKANYPYEIGLLIANKLFSRINSITKHLGLENEVKIYKENRNLTLGNVKNGKLVSGEFKEYVNEFYEKDPKSPYRFSELFRLFRTQLTFSSLSSTMDYAVNRFVPGLKIDDAIESISKKIAKAQKTKGMIPLKMWSSPIFNGRIFANRNIVFGQYLGMNAPIQLVDSVGAEISLGAFNSFTGLTNSRPILNTTASIGRSYIHVRSMPDLKAASKQKVKNIFIPGLLKRLGKVIKDEYECTIPQVAFIEEGELSGIKIYYIKYDFNNVEGRKQAIQKRNELVEKGIEPSKILIVKIDRKDLCSSEISNNRNRNMEEFLKQFALNESFIINDNLKLGSRFNAPIPVSNLSGASINLGAEASTALLRGVLIRRTQYGIEVTIQQQKNIKTTLEQGLNYFLELLKNSNEWVNGKMYSKVYKIQLEDISQEDKEIALKTLRELFVTSGHELMMKHFHPFKLDHDVKTKLNRWKLLWHKSEKMTMDHELEIKVPQKKGEDFTKQERTRILFSSAKYIRKGNDYYNFADKLAATFSGFINLGANDGDPGQSFLGNSQKRYYITEGELTSNRKLNPVSRIEYIKTGWKIKTEKLFSYFDDIDFMFRGFNPNQLIDRGAFQASPLLHSYDVRTTIILYPKAFNKIKKLIFNTSENEFINNLKILFGQYHWKKYCTGAIEFFGRDGPQSYYGQKYYECLPVVVHELIDIRNVGLPKERKKLIQKINWIYYLFFDFFQKDQLLFWLNEDSFFASTRVTGFRENHHLGYLELISDTVGTYNPKHGTGVFDQISSYFGLSPYELRALNYTPGM